MKLISLMDLSQILRSSVSVLAIHLRLVFWTRPLPTSMNKTSECRLNVIFVFGGEKRYQHLNIKHEYGFCLLVFYCSHVLHLEMGSITLTKPLVLPVKVLLWIQSLTCRHIYPMHTWTYLSLPIPRNCCIFNTYGKV